MVIALYTDYLLLAGNDMITISWMYTELTKMFEMKDLGKSKLC